MKSQTVLSFVLIALLLGSVLTLAFNQHAFALTALTTSNEGSITDGNQNWALSGSVWETSTDAYVVAGSGGVYNIYRFNYATSTLTSDINNVIGSVVRTWTNPAVATSTAAINHYHNQLNNADVGLVTLNDAAAEKITATSVLAGTKIDQIKVWLIDVSAPTAGVVTIGTFDAAGAIVCNFGTEDFTSVTASWVQFTKTLAAGTFCTVSAGQYIGIKATTAVVSGSIHIGDTSPSGYDGLNSVGSVFAAGAWVDDNTKDRAITATTLEGDYLMNDNITTEKNFWRNNVDSESGGNFYMNLGSSKTVYGVEIYSTSSTLVHMNQENGANTNLNVLSSTGPTTGAAEKVGTGSVLIGDVVNSITAGLIKTGAPTGTLTAGVFDSTGATLFTFGTIDVTTITTSMASYTFTAPSGTHTLAVNQYVGFRGPAPSAGNSVLMSSTTPDAFDTTNSYVSQFPGAWADATTFDVGSTANTFKIENTNLNVPDQIEITVSTDTTFNETPATCTLTDTNGLQTCDLTLDPTGQYVELLVSSWGTSVRWTVNEVDPLSTGTAATIHGFATNIDTDGDFFVVGLVSSGGNIVVSEVNVDGTFKNGFEIDDGLDMRSIRGAESTKNGVWYTGYVESGTTDDLAIGVFDRALTALTVESIVAGECSDIEDSGALTVVEGANLAADRAYVLNVQDNAPGTLNLCYDETDITGVTVATAITPPAADPNQLQLVPLSGKLLAYGSAGLWEITVPGHVITQVRTVAPTTYPTQTFNQTASARTFIADDVAYISDATGNSDVYTPSTGVSTVGHTLIESLTPATQTMTPESSAKYYRIGNVGILSATTTTTATWTFESFVGLESFEVDIYEELLSASLFVNNDLADDNILIIICDTNSYEMNFPKIDVSDNSGCTSITTKDITTNPIGRTLPLTGDSVDVVWAAEYTNYQIHVTLVSGDAEDYDANIVYDGINVDRSHFDGGDNAQVRLLYGQCYTLEYIVVLTGLVAQTTNICADDVIFKEDVISTSLGFTFFSAPWGATHFYNDTSFILTTIVHHDPAPYNYTVNIINGTGHTIDSSFYEAVTDIDIQTYNATLVANCDEDNQAPLKVQIFNNEDRLFYDQYFESCGDYLTPLSILFSASLGDFAGWNLLLFLPIVFAAIFTRNTAGIGGGMIMAFIGIIVTFGLIEVPESAIWIMVFVAVIGILAYKIARD